MKSKYLSMIKDIEEVGKLINSGNTNFDKDSVETIVDALSIAQMHYEQMYLAVPQEMENFWIDPNIIAPKENEKVMVKGSRGARMVCTYKNGKFYDVGRNRIRKGVVGYVHIPE